MKRIKKPKKSRNWLPLRVTPRNLLLSVATCTAIALSSCGRPPLPTPQPVVTAYTPSPTPTSTLTPAYTPSPTATPTSAPTSTYTPSPTPTNTPTPTMTPTPKMVCVKFFYDGNMNNLRDETEPFLSPNVKGYRQSQDGCYYVPEGRKTKLYITGKAPNGKDLLNATLDWPRGVNLLPEITVDTTKVSEIGLVDGFCSAPIKPEDLFREEYERFVNDKDLWYSLYRKYFNNSPIPPNWLFYGYNLYWNDPEGKVRLHLAFDIWGKDGTPVYAPVPGTVSELFGNAININYGRGKVNLGHITPIVGRNDRVEAGQLVGHIIGSEGNHVHMELIPYGDTILNCFAGLTPNDLIKDPREGPPPVLPYFGR